MPAGGAPSHQYRMIDVGGKNITRRRAIATGRIRLGPVAYPMVRDRRLPKGDPLVLAETAGILAAKKTADLIPLCHPLGLDHVVVAFEFDPAGESVSVFCQASTSARTGVEMEALAGAQTALLTIWDLAKQVEPALAIDGIRLVLKEGGKSGRWIHPDGLPDLPADFVARDSNGPLGDVPNE
ncbi:MAG: cyclic pyranopterin monophosphate synthase MoaC [Wenzhouxiangellaceae bacterium]|nr:cyclic pyranopterin monophosphate synthase MoaC [Wenzhouxiangellaceae bacterium]MBS3746374.1 cyclic pyranopterin monophosphate synthase MoaC [Wenzhouxiangellaceae bacterium]MBS3823703.1 cyclic pyranopterin monophosphate synthase MoaC [Wenzhouxiangellaceae bacterium]